MTPARRIRLWMSSAAFGLLSATLVLPAPTALAQRDEELADPQTRQRLYDELARDVERLELPLGILKRVARLAAPSVVHIEAHKGRAYDVGYGSPTDIEEAGSGVIVALGERIFVLTNRHVIRDAKLKDIGIHLYDGRILRPTEAWSDPNSDVGVMALPEDVYIPARLGSSHSMEIGDFVVAVGSPFGLSQSITHGIISAKGRHGLDLGKGEVPLQNFLQTDAAINPGNSGGPLLNLRGEVIGLNTAIASSSGGNEGIGFSIPIRTAVHIARQLVETGEARRAFLGVSLDSAYSARLASRSAGSRLQGAWVSGVTAESPAADAGLAAGDLILFFDDVRIKNHSHLINVVGLTEVGREVDVVVLREGRRRAMKVLLSPRDDTQE